MTNFDINFLNHVTDSVICTPDFHKNPINDRFAICNLNNYLVYGYVFEKLFDYSLKKELHSETFLNHILKNAKIKNKDINYIFARVRANGVVNNLDKKLLSKPNKPNKTNQINQIIKKPNNIKKL